MYPIFYPLKGDYKVWAVKGPFTEDVWAMEGYVGLGSGLGSQGSHFKEGVWLIQDRCPGNCGILVGFGF